jgi:hypothetical protein
MGAFKVWRFEDLLEAALSMHRNYLSIVKNRASSNDPRIRDLDDIGASLVRKRGRRGMTMSSAKKGSRRKKMARGKGRNRSS